MRHGMTRRDATEDAPVRRNGTWWHGLAEWFCGCVETWRSGGIIRHDMVRWTQRPEREKGTRLITFEKKYGPVCRERESHSDPRLFFSSFRR